MSKKLTTKNLEILTEMMMLEELAYKKATEYKSKFKDQQLKDQFNVLAQNHKSRYTKLNDYLAIHN
ncbi:MAG: hypothetical protein GX756_05475 [Clostridiales bacterium]|nr:hypothetical protein [Clostridiales bacterium]